MTQNEMLNKLLNQAGWVITAETTDDGYTVCRAEAKTEQPGE